MDRSFFTFFEKLESLAFFAGFPLIFAIVLVLAGKKRDSPSHPASILIKSLPLGYALTGTLFIGMQIRNLYPGVSAEEINTFLNGHWSRVWALSVVLFWIPFLHKKPFWSLLHSLVFFFLLVNDFFKGNNDVTRNNMKVYTDSLILNTFTLLVVFTIYILYTRFLATRLRSKKHSSL